MTDRWCSVFIYRRYKLLTWATPSGEINYFGFWRIVQGYTQSPIPPVSLIILSALCKAWKGVLSTVLCNDSQIDKYLSVWFSQCSNISQRDVAGGNVCCNLSPLSNCRAITTSLSARDFSPFTSSSLALFGRLAYLTDKVKSSVILPCLKHRIILNTLYIY